MKASEGIKTMLAIYNTDGSPTQYCINKIYDRELKQCLCLIEDIEFNNEHDVRLMSRYIFNKEGDISDYIGEVGPGIILPIEVIEMININHFEQFYA